jgi:guanine deaminase
MTANTDVRFNHAIAVDTVRAATAEVAGGGLPFVTTIVTAQGFALPPTPNRVSEQSDPTAHAEVAAIREACLELGIDGVRGGTIYTSCSPCSLCYVSAFYAGIVTIFYSVTREEAGTHGCDLRGTYLQFPRETEGWGPDTVFVDLEDRLRPFIEWTRS